MSETKVFCYERSETQAPECPNKPMAFCVAPRNPAGTEKYVYLEHGYTEDGALHGGNAHGYGFSIVWQNGPTGGDRDGRNGAFVEELLAACMERLKAFQVTRFKHPANAEASRLIGEAIDVLHNRQADRVERAVYGMDQI